METGFEANPTVNMNVFINNYININTNGFDGKVPNFKNFPQPPQKAKPELKLKKLGTSTSLEAPTKASSQSTSPKASHSLHDSFRAHEENQVKPIISQGKQSDLYEPREKPFEDSSIIQMIGLCLIALSGALFIGVFYSLFIAPIVGKTGHIILDFIQQDSFYCCLIPLMIPVSLLFLYVNWVSVKFFRHS